MTSRTFGNDSTNDGYQPIRGKYGKTKMEYKSVPTYLIRNNNPMDYWKIIGEGDTESNSSLELPMEISIWVIVQVRKDTCLSTEDEDTLTSRTSRYNCSSKGELILDTRVTITNPSCYNWITELFIQ